MINESLRWLAGGVAFAGTSDSNWVLSNSCCSTFAIIYSCNVEFRERTLAKIEALRWALRACSGASSVAGIT